MSSMKTKAERDEARRICEAATEGPWEYQRLDGATMSLVGSAKWVTAGIPNVNESRDEDGAFIAHARNTYIQILDAYEEVEAQIEELESEAKIMARAIIWVQANPTATVKEAMEWARAEMEAEDK